MSEMRWGVTVAPEDWRTSRIGVVVPARWVHIIESHVLFMMDMHAGTEQHKSNFKKSLRQRSAINLNVSKCKLPFSPYPITTNHTNTQTKFDKPCATVLTQM